MEMKATPPCPREKFWCVCAPPPICLFVLLKSHIGNAEKSRSFFRYIAGQAFLRQQEGKMSTLYSESFPLWRGSYAQLVLKYDSTLRRRETFWSNHGIAGGYIDFHTSHQTSDFLSCPCVLICYSDYLWQDHKFSPGCCDRVWALPDCLHPPPPSSQCCPCRTQHGENGDKTRIS